MSFIRTTAKKWIRPPFVPVIRHFVRYTSSDSLRRMLWTRVVGPYFQHASHKFLVRSAFGSLISGDTEDLIQRYIFYFGVWEPNLTAFVQRTLKEGDVFIDVGANIGYFSLLGAQLVGKSGKVIAIEASPSIAEKLVENLKRNRTTNTEVVNVAVSDHEGVLKLYAAPNSNIGETRIYDGEGYRCECEVAAKPLSAIVTDPDMQRVRLIKVDVEGAEWPVIAGMRKLLGNARRDMEVVIEIKPEYLARQGKSVEDVFGAFDKFGFFPYRLDNDYSALSYTRRGTAPRPARIRGPFLKQTDVIFSRVDAEML